MCSQKKQIHKKILTLAAAAALLCAFACGCAQPNSPSRAASAAGDAYEGPAPAFSEIVPRNKSGLRAADGKYYPWVELVNDKETPLQLAEHYLTDDKSDPKRWQFPSVVLQPGERRVVFLSGLAHAEGGMHAGFALREDRNTLYLADLNGNVVDSISWVLPAVSNMAVVKEGYAVQYTPFPTPGEPNDPRALAHSTPENITESDPVILNELLLENRKGLADSDGDRPAWVELYNRSAVPVSLLGYALSDRLGDTARWLLPDITLAPGEYRVVFLSGKDRYEGELHANFTPDPESPAITLTALGENRMDFIPVVKKVPAAFAIGRTEDGSFRLFASPTPGEANSGMTFEAYKYTILAE